MKGFTDESGKFRPMTPYTKKGVRKSKDQKAKTQGIRMKRSDGSRIKKIQFKVWKFEDAPSELQEKILEKNRNINLDDDFWADYDGLIYDKKTKISDYDVFKNYSKKYYDLDRGQYIQFPDLEIKDEKKLAEMLEIPESLADRIDFIFKNERERNTELTVRDLGTYEDITEDTEYEDYAKYSDIQSYGEKKLTKSEFEKIQKAIEKWSDLVHQAWVNLRDNYEYQYSDESVKETLVENEYEFDEDGNIA